MDDTTLVTKVKEALGITTNDEAVINNIKLKTMTAKGYLIKGGALHMKNDPVTKENLIDDIDVSCIAIGVNDLLNCKPGETKFSPAFNILSLQICRG
jgi:hypothetical protein